MYLFIIIIIILAFELVGFLFKIAWPILLGVGAFVFIAALIETRKQKKISGNNQKVIEGEFTEREAVNDDRKSE